MAAILKLYFKICSRVCYDCLSVVPGLYSSFPWICVFLLLFLRIHFLCPVPHDKRLAICLQFYCPSHCPFFSSLKKMGESVFFLLIPSIVILITVVEFPPLWKLMYLKRFWTGIVLGIVIVLNFESFFFALLASVSLGNKNGCKFQHYDYA